MATLTGKAFVWGVSGVTFTGVAISSTTGQIQDFTFNREASKDALVNADGDTVGLVFYDLKKTITVSVVPSDASSITTAKSNMNSMLPAPGTVVTCVDADTTVVDGTHSGAYICTGSNLKRSSKGVAIIEMQLEQYDANNVSTTVS